MSNTKTSVALLRGLITEMITVAVEHPNSAELKLYELGDDEGDELEWYLDKYGRPSWESTEKFLKKGEKFVKATRKGAEPELSKLDPFYGMDLEKRSAAIKSINELISNLVPDDQAGKLKETILPWGAVGFDALRRVFIAEKRTGKEFPFFAAADKVRVGETIPFPTEPTKAVVDFLASQRTRIGTNDTGKGELLLALMTGGTPPSSKGVGDIVIDGQAWEVKDMRSTAAARVGDLHSGEFIEAVKRWLLDTRFGVKVDDYIATLRSTKTIPTKDLPTLNGILHSVMSKGLAGIILVGDGNFTVSPIENIEFSSLSKAGRVHFTVSKSKVVSASAAARREDEAQADRVESELP